MTSIQVLTMALYVVNAGLSFAVAKRQKLHRPVAWYLVAAVVIDLARFGLSQLLPATPPSRPVEGSTLIIRQAEQACYLGAIMNLPAMNMALFLRKRPWIIGALYLAILVALLASYPAVRGHELMRLYTAIDLAGFVASVGFFIMWLRSPRFLEETRSVPIMCGLALTAGTLATTVLPKLSGDELLHNWPVVVAANAIALALVLVFQLRFLITGREKLP